MTKIIILAKSKKDNGVCLAGKELKTYKWIRPVLSSPPFSQNDFNRLSSKTGGPNLLDIVEMNFSGSKAEPFQPENKLLNEEKWFIEPKPFPKEKLNDLVDSGSTNLLESTTWKQDRVHVNFFKKYKLQSSLQFLHLTPENKPILYLKGYQPRLKFMYESNSYDLVITDLNYQGIKTAPSDRKIEDIFITIGLGKEFQSNHYKLIVGLIPNT